LAAARRWSNAAKPVTIAIHPAPRTRPARTTEFPMPKGYWVSIYRSISDEDKLAAYAKLAPEAIAPFGGRYLARGTAAAAYDAGLKDRIVMSEFPSVEQANAAYNSPGYQNALKALGNGAVRDIRIIAGLE
jgi:uncharacterized protein (DUF1330 family)